MAFISASNSTLSSIRAMRAAALSPHSLNTCVLRTLWSPHWSRHWSRRIGITLFAISATLLFPKPAIAFYSPPVDAQIVDYFRKPETFYSEGNRGLEYQTTSGTIARAAEDGIVTFAGRVANTNYVVVTHADGLRTTYGNLASISVAQGNQIAAGTQLGVTTNSLHFGVRRGTEYLDPMSFFGAHAHLVPLDDDRTALVRAGVEGFAQAKSVRSTGGSIATNEKQSLADPARVAVGAVGGAALGLGAAWRRKNTTLGLGPKLASSD